jgi:hypothetical protein
MPTSATAPIRRPGQRKADRRLTSAIIDRIASELILAPAITQSGEPWDPAVPAAATAPVVAAVPAVLAAPASTNT